VTLAVELGALHEGSINWNEFVRRTVSDWTGLAWQITKFYRNALPPSVTPEDIRQELLMWAWHYFQRWTPEGGCPLHVYVTRGAYTNARTWMNGQRRSLRRSGRAPSRLPVLVADLDTLTAAPWLVTAGCADNEEPLQERSLRRREALERFKANAQTVREKATVNALEHCGGDVAAAIEYIYDNPTVRRQCRLGCRQEARRAVVRAVQAMATKED
jgi:hypothetical protein